MKRYLIILSFCQLAFFNNHDLTGQANSDRKFGLYVKANLNYQYRNPDDSYSLAKAWTTITPVSVDNFSIRDGFPVELKVNLKLFRYLGIGIYASHSAFYHSYSSSYETTVASIAEYASYGWTTYYTYSSYDYSTQLNWNLTVSGIHYGINLDLNIPIFNERLIMAFSYVQGFSTLCGSSYQYRMNKDVDLKVRLLGTGIFRQYGCDLFYNFNDGFAIGLGAGMQDAIIDKIGYKVIKDEPNLQFLFGKEEGRFIDFEGYPVKTDFSGLNFHLSLLFNY